MADPAPSITGTFRKPFEEQIAAFRLRLGNLIPTSAWDDLMHEMHDRAFVVAGATKADLLADLAAAVDKAIAKGTGLEEFRRDFRRIVQERGWHGWTGEGTKKGEAWRTKVIYKTNMRTSYMAGRLAQLVAGKYEFWVYRHGGSLEPRLQHLGWDGLILPPHHPFWETHFPPNGWGCSCRVYGATSMRSAKTKGGKPEVKLGDGWDKINPATGVPPGISKGWAYPVGGSVVDDVIRIAAEKASTLPPAIAASVKTSASMVADGHEASIEALLEDVVREFYPGQDAGQTVKILMAEAALRDDPHLTDARKALLLGYTSNAFYLQINEQLRQAALGNRSLHPAVADYVLALDHALGRLPRFRGTVWRGINDVSAEHREAFQGLTQGDVVSFNGYTSTSWDESTAFSGKIILKITGRSGRKIAHLSMLPTEREVLLGRGLQYRVIEHTSENGVLHFELEELAPSEWTSNVKAMMYDLGLG